MQTAIHFINFVSLPLPNHLQTEDDFCEMIYFEEFLWFYPVSHL